MTDINPAWLLPETNPELLIERLRARSRIEGETEGNSLYRDAANALEAASKPTPGTTWIEFEFELVNGKRFTGSVETVKMHNTVNGVPVILVSADNGCHRTVAVPDIKIMLAGAL